MTKVRVGLVALTAGLVLASGAAAVSIVVNGTISASDPTQTGRITRNGVASTCAASKPNPGLAAATGSRNYDSVVYTNSSGSGECISVGLSQTSGTVGELFDAAYLGSFNPADPSQNYLADPGTSPLALNTPLTYSLFLPAGQTVVVVVHEVNPGGCTGCDYTLTLDSATAATFASARLTPTHRGLLLRWRTASEVDLLDFQVYRSRGYSWRRVSHTPIAAKGSVAGASYRFLDRAARPHKGWRYRIKAFDQDGTSSWFGPVLTS